MIVLVESHTKARAQRTPPRPAPDSGARWGRASRFRFDQSAADAEMEERGGVTLVWPAKRIKTTKVNNFTPVWRKIDIINLPSVAAPETMQEVAVTTEMLFPVSQTRQSYIGGGTGYVEDPGDQVYEDRIIHTFLLLRMPPPEPEAEVLRSEVKGQWPSLPEEMFRPGTFVYVPPIPGDWHR